MKKKNDLDRIPLECYPNGSLEILPAKEVRTLIPKANYIWILLADLYIWLFSNCKGRNHIFQHAGKPSIAYAKLVHTNEKNPVSIDQAESQFDMTMLESGTLSAWICRFNRIYRKEYRPIGKPLSSELWPMRFLMVPGVMGILRPAYQMKHEYTSMVVSKVDQSSEYKDFLFPWNYLWEGLF